MTTQHSLSQSWPGQRCRSKHQHKKCACMLHAPFYRLLACLGDIAMEPCGLVEEGGMRSRGILTQRTLNGDFKSNMHDRVLASSAAAQACCIAVMIWAVIKSNKAGSAVKRSIDSRKFLVGNGRERIIVRGSMHT